MAYEYPYPQGFSCESADIDGNCRYSLKIVNSNTSKPETLFVLMMNPSTANGNQSDQTVNGLLTGVGKEYQKIIIVNVSPVMIEKKDKFSEDSDEEKTGITERNIRAIKGLLRESENIYFLVGTGNISDTDEETYVKIMNIISNVVGKDEIHAMELNQTGYSINPIVAALADYKNTESLKSVYKYDDRWHLKKSEI
ncbi:DUF1643 domain-containing protein [Lactiplantibacillus dongliensis]|uniref:DUF1643 domain-containing protein n=1 Tax=Lactiplantibacillus dongliensis TaxID=2559919 RepID=A0ABW1R4C9_9LACO|nr:DUF1643 domain-containing protein [Lactiplantibacillus dongliensis]